MRTLCRPIALDHSRTVNSASRSRIQIAYLFFEFCAGRPGTAPIPPGAENSRCRYSVNVETVSMTTAVNGHWPARRSSKSHDICST